MSLERPNLAPRTSNAVRPLPPEVKFDPAARRFHGTAQPGKLVQMTSSVDAQTHTVEVDLDGSWAIDLGYKPHWFTIFRIWACDPSSDVTSPGVQVTFGGKRPRLQDVYACERVIFGRCNTAATEIAAFGAAGQLLGKSFLIGEGGGWSIAFPERLEPGERICVVARLLSGNTSLPLSVEVDKFSVLERNIAKLGGDGAMPGDVIEIFDIALGHCIAEAQADEAGAWSISFESRLEPGSRLRLTRAHANGSRSEGPVVTAITDPCLPPEIDVVSAKSVVGTAQPGLDVHCGHFRRGLRLAAYIAPVSDSGSWSIDGLDIWDGDSIVATTRSRDGTASSRACAATTHASYVPGLPLLSHIDAQGASGLANPDEFVVAFSAVGDVVGWAKVLKDATWSLTWAELPDSLAKTTIVRFASYSGLVGKGVGISSSCFAARFASLSSWKPDPPVIVSYKDLVVSGTETTPDTKVKVVDDTQFKNGVGSPATVNDGNWSTSADPDSPPNFGDALYAYASSTAPTTFGITSENSTLFYVTQT
ncbi:hypothetical protein [Martelella sp. AMO21009]